MKNIISKMHNHILGYDFELIDTRIGKNGIERQYLSRLFFENKDLILKLDNNGINVKLYENETLIFADDLSMEIIKQFNNEGINLSVLLDIIIDTVDEYLDDLQELKEAVKRGVFNEK